MYTQRHLAAKLLTFMIVMVEMARSELVKIGCAYGVFIVVLSL